MSDQLDGMNNIESINTMEVGKLADDVKAGDDAINKLKVQNLDFILDPS